MLTSPLAAEKAQEDAKEALDALARARESAVNRVVSPP